jgi:hypothetical protein
MHRTAKRSSPGEAAIAGKVSEKTSPAVDRKFWSTHVAATLPRTILKATLSAFEKRTWKLIDGHQDSLAESATLHSVPGSGSRLRGGQRARSESVLLSVGKARVNQYNLAHDHTFRCF